MMFGIRNYPDWRSGVKYAFVITAIIFPIMVACDIWDLYSSGLEVTRELLWHVVGSGIVTCIPCFVALVILEGFRPAFMKKKDNKAMDDTGE